MFSGQYQHTLDKKGRVILPSKLRQKLEEGVMITVWPGPCLLLIPKFSWPNWEDRLIDLSKARKKSLDFSRFFYAHLQEETLDRQGRVFIAPELRSWAGLEKDVVIVGMGDRLEVWGMKEWQAYVARVSGDYEEIVEELDL